SCPARSNVRFGSEADLSPLLERRRLYASKRRRRWDRPPVTAASWPSAGLAIFIEQPISAGRQSIPARQLATGGAWRRLVKPIARPSHFGSTTCSHARSAA